MQYEYKSVVFEVPRKFGILGSKPVVDDLPEIDEKLKELGSEGWQMVGVFPITDGANPSQISKAIHYFMRPK